MNKSFFPAEARIEAIVAENHDTLTYTLNFKDKAKHEEYAFASGQFNMVSLLGYGEVPISFSSDPSIRRYFQHTIKAVGGVTRAMAGLREGDVVGVRGPFGRGWPLHEIPGNDVVVIAGGIGLAPLRPVIEHILGNRPVYGRLVILYGARTPKDLVFSRDFARWSASPETDLQLTVDRTNGEPWEHNVGVVPTLFKRVELSPQTSVALVCGPDVMMRFVTLDLLNKGFAPERIYLSVERRMVCGTAQCGHCYLGPKYVCKHGPVFPYSDLRGLFDKGV